jgi:hypothetical protein
MQPEASPYKMANNSPVMYVDPFGLSEEEYANNIARCPTCPNDAKYDDKRASNDLFVYYPELGEALYFVDEESEFNGVRYPSSYGTANVPRDYMGLPRQEKGFDYVNAALTVPDSYGTALGEFHNITKPIAGVGTASKASKAANASKLGYLLKATNGIGLAGDFYTIVKTIGAVSHGKAGDLTVKDWFDAGISLVSFTATMAVYGGAAIAASPVIEAIAITGAVWGTISLTIDIANSYNNK